MVTSPTGELTVNSGTQYTAWRGQPLSPQFVDSYKFFFPEDEYADYLLSNEKKYAKFCDARITSAEKNQSLDDIFRMDGTAYDPKEIEFIKTMTKR